MLLRFEATNGGAKFSEIADEVILLDIIEQPAEVDVQKSRLAGGAGMRVSSVTRTSLTVNLVYVIRTQDPVRWGQVHDLVSKWAKRGHAYNNYNTELTVSTRPGVYLSGRFYVPPVRNSALRWTQEQTLTFVAYDVPYWQDKNVSISRFLSKGETTTIDCNCTADRVPLELTITNDTSKPITEIKIVAANSYKMHLTGLNLVTPPQDPGYIVEEHSLVIKAEDGHTTRIFVTDEHNTSMLHTRTTDSVDVLDVPTSEPIPVYFWADQSATCWLKCRRWWV